MIKVGKKTLALCTGLCAVAGLMGGCEEELPQPGSVPNESQGADDGYITTLPDQGTTANGHCQIINLQNHRSFVVHVPVNADERHRLLVVVAMHGYEMDVGTTCGDELGR